MQKKKDVQIIYELSEKGQRDAFVKELDTSKVQFFISQYEDWMKDLLDFNYSGEACIFVNNIIQDFSIDSDIFDYRILEVKDMTFDFMPTEKQVLGWIKEQVLSKENKYQTILKKQQEILNNKKEEKYELNSNFQKKESKTTLILLAGLGFVVGATITMYLFKMLGIN